MRVLTVNAGSSTLKLRLVEGEDLLAGRRFETPEGYADEQELTEILRSLPRPDAVGHRVVHGGGVFSSAVRLRPEVRARLEEFVPLAPLHQPAALTGIDLIAKLLPDVPAVACFDTTFHSTLPQEAHTYAVPEEWRSRFGVRRYGFHGLSHAYAAGRAARLLGRDDPDLRLVICHLGAGASLSAVRGGTCLDTTMGLTPMEGLVMATRSGDVDPGMLLWLAGEQGIAVPELTEALLHRSGLQGLAGTSDMRAVLRGVDEADPRAEFAMGVYVHRLRSGIAAMAAATGGLDALVFTGGVGERAALVRSRAVSGLEFLGPVLDARANSKAVPDADVSAPGTRCRCLVVAAREDLQIAVEVRRLLQGSGPDRPAGTQKPAGTQERRADL